MMGSIIANGVINAAGRNATISLLTRDGNVRQNAVTGMVLFLQHWFWYPMLNFLNLALIPNTLVAVNSDLKVPKSFQIKLNAKPSLFKYPEFMKRDDGKKKDKVETAVLSTTAKVKARVERKKKEEGGDVSMSESGVATPSKSAAKDDAEMKDETKKEGEDEEKKEEEKKDDEPEATEGVVSNPSRVLKT